MTLNKLRLCVRCLAILILAACFSSISLNAQSTTQGSIAGSVLDSSGAAIPGAAVSIQRTATGFTIKLVTDSSGYFKAPLLEPGTYTVTLSASGFAKYRADGVTVQVGQVTTLEPHLALASASTSVVVTEQAPVLNIDSPDVSAELNTRALETIPINNRRWSGLAMTTPGIVADTSGFGLISVRGISTILNNVEIDGADDNQAYYAEERGRTREAYSTSGSAVREFAVNTGVYSAEYGRAAGGVVTSVTKSGSNELHGQLYFYDRESKWNAFNDFAKVSVLNPANDAYVPTPIKPEDLRKIYGFTAGGAIVKDKLFWIYTYDQHSHVNPIVGIPNSPFLLHAARRRRCLREQDCNLTTGALAATLPAADIHDSYACTLAARQGISYAQASYDWAALLYGIAAVSVASYAGATAVSDAGSQHRHRHLPRRGYQEINTPKLDWQVNPKEHCQFPLPSPALGFARRRADRNPDHYAFDTQGNDFVKLDYGVTKLTSFITTSISNELLYQYGRELDYDEGSSPSPLTPRPTSPPATAACRNLKRLFNHGFYLGSPYY